jgi:cytochrome bd ubiquinol oxidase subunit II
MSLQELPMVFVLLGLVFYVVLGGADFGAAIWQVVTGPGERGERIREHAHEAVGPVWEANHVWLIFVLTVTWTAYPVAFGSLASTLCVALFVAGLGIIVRGAAYALRSGTSDLREIGRIDAASAVSAVLTPFALGAAVGGLASGRVPFGNAKGDLITSWLNPTSIFIGALAVAFCAYLAAVYLAADAARRGDADLVAAFRVRALGAGAVAGALSVAGLVVLHHDAHRLYHELVAGDGRPALIVSVIAGLATFALVVRERFEPARFTAAAAVAAIVAGWALAQQPIFLPGLTIEQAAAPHDVLVTTVVAILGGAIILFPSLVLLFRLTLGGQLGHAHEEHAAAPGPARDLVLAAAPGLLGRVAVACLVVGFGLLTVAEAGWAHGLGVVALFAFIVVGFAGTVPALLEGEPGS